MLEVDPRARRHKRLLRHQKWEITMDWNRVEGNWKQVKGQVKEKWGKLTDDELDKMNGRRESPSGDFIKDCIAFVT